MRNEGIVEIDLGGKLQVTTGIEYVALDRGKLDINFIDEERATECLQFAMIQRQFSLTLRLTGALEFETDDAKVTGFGYDSKKMKGLLFLSLG